MSEVEQILLNRVKLIEDDSWSLIGSPMSLIKELEALISDQVAKARIDELERLLRPFLNKRVAIQERIAKIKRSKE